MNTYTSFTKCNSKSKSDHEWHTIQMEWFLQQEQNMLHQVTWHSYRWHFLYKIKKICIKDQSSHEISEEWNGKLKKISNYIVIQVKSLSELNTWKPSMVNVLWHKNAVSDLFPISMLILNIYKRAITIVRSTHVRPKRLQFEHCCEWPRGTSEWREWKTFTLRQQCFKHN